MDRTLDNTTYMQSTSLRGSNTPSKVAAVLNEAYIKNAIRRKEGSDTLVYRYPVNKIYSDVIKKISAGLYF